MSINLISDSINRLVQRQPRPFTTHDLISNLIENQNFEWEQLVNSYSGNRSIQEQKAVQQIGRYLGRNANRLGISQDITITNPTIIGLDRHNPQRTTLWF